MKYVQPWAELAKGPLPAERTLLLDYVTDFQIVAFWRSLRLRHITVSSTILIFVLIKALTVISTGLLSLDPTLFDGVAQQMSVTTAFDGSTGLSMDEIDSRAAVALYGHAKYGMFLPNGTSQQYAYQLFQPDITSPGTIYSYNASVDVFMADGWECESGTLTSEVGYDHDGDGDFGGQNTPTASFFNTTIKLPGCEIYHGHLDAPSWYYEQNDTTPRYGYWGTFQRVNCSNLDPSDPNFRRYTVAVAYSEGHGQNNNTMLNSSNVVCRPSYKIQPAYVTAFANGSVGNDVIFHGNARQLDGVTADDVALAVWSTLRQTSIPFQFDSYNVTTDQFMNNMIRLTPDFKPEMLMDTTWLAETSRQVYQQNAAQIAGLYLVKTNSQATLVQGTISQLQERLRVKSVPTRLMQSCAIVMLLLTIAMFFVIPQNVVPRPIESVAAVAVILARSPRLVEILRNTGHLTLTELRKVLSGHSFKSTVSNVPEGKVFSIEVVTGPATAPSPAGHKNIKWSRPLVLHRIAMTLMLCLAVAVMIAIEVLYQQARSNNGLANVNDESLQRYVWLYTPTVVLVLLATTFNILDFELEFSDPYHELARGHANASSSLLWDPLRNVTVQTCFHAAKHSRFALVASSISVILAPFLTIVVSGLFVAQKVPDFQNTTATSLTWFNLSSSEDYTISDQASTFTLPSLILQGNMSYPQWTYDELAFPSIDLSSTSLKIGNSTTGTLDVQTPAVRASVNCTTIPQSDVFNITFDGTYVSYNLSTPSGCGNTGYIDQNYLSYVGTTSGPTSGTGYFAGIANGPGFTTLVTTNDTILCPQYIAVFGRVEDSVMKDTNVVYCNTGFESVSTLSQVDMQLLTVASIASVNESSAKIFNPYWSTPAGSGSPYFIPINITDPANDESLDDFVSAMVYGKDGIPTSQLLTSATLFTSQFIHTYRQWTAQWANIYMRDSIQTLSTNSSNIAADALPTALPARYSNPTRERLFLNTISTRILEGVIALLVVCGITIFVLVDMSHVLPKKVGSIAAVASLLAGSRLLDEQEGVIRPGMEWLSDGEIARGKMLAGWKFRMGWWNEGGRADGRRGSNAGAVANGEGQGDKGFFGIDVVRPSDMS